MSDDDRDIDIESDVSSVLRTNKKKKKQICQQMFRLLFSG